MPKRKVNFISQDRRESSRTKLLKLKSDSQRSEYLSQSAKIDNYSKDASSKSLGDGAQADGVNGCSTLAADSWATTIEASTKTPQMTYERYRALLHSLGHVKETAGAPKATGRPADLSGNDLGPRSDRKTDFRADQAEWSIDNLPEILYAFEEPKGYYNISLLKEPPRKSYTIYGKALRDIPILPDRISPDPEGWLLEYWFRMDPRITYEQDIAPRICEKIRPLYGSRFSNARGRFRLECYLLGWVTKGRHYLADREDIVEAAAGADVDAEATNSTRGLSWGLIHPDQGEGGGRIPVPDNFRPRNTRDNGPGTCAAKLSSIIHDETTTRCSCTSADQPNSIVLAKARLRSTRANNLGTRARKPSSIIGDETTANAPSTSVLQLNSAVSVDARRTPNSSLPLPAHPSPNGKTSTVSTNSLGWIPTSDAKPPPFELYHELFLLETLETAPQWSLSSSYAAMPHVYEGYAWRDEVFVPDAMGTYFPVPFTHRTTQPR